MGKSGRSNKPQGGRVVRFDAGILRGWKGCPVSALMIFSSTDKHTCVCNIYKYSPESMEPYILPIAIPKGSYCGCEHAHINKW